jgi:hypothetical protein
MPEFRRPSPGSIQADQTLPSGTCHVAGPGARTWAIAALAALIGTALGAQAPATEAEIPIVTGATRQPRLELPAGGSESGQVRSIRVYRWEAPIEILARYYLQHLGGRRDAVLDTAALHPGETTPISYHLTFHSLEDECADSAAGIPAGGKACTVWKRGKDKKRALVNSRLGYEPELWVERLTFRWFSRDPGGDLVEWRVELSDSGLSENWKHYLPNAQLTIESVQLKRSVP